MVSALTPLLRDRYL